MKISFAQGDCKVEYENTDKNETIMVKQIKLDGDNNYVWLDYKDFRAIIDGLFYAIDSQDPIILGGPKDE